LDNKELLAICDQLNISVKHSSTITESEAERIRAAAEKQAANVASSRKESGKPKGSRTSVYRAKPKPSLPHKQQILRFVDLRL